MTTLKPKQFTSVLLQLGKHSGTGRGENTRIKTQSKGGETGTDHLEDE